MSQSLHPDFETTLPETEYFFLGGGGLEAAIQWSTNEDATPLGLLIQYSGPYGRKWSSYSFHPEYGLSRTMLTVILEGVRYQPDHNTRVVWYPAETPGIVAMWQAGEATVIETFYANPDETLLIREVTVQKPEGLAEAALEVSLYANPAHFHAFSGNEYTLEAAGRDLYLSVGSALPGVYKERTLTVPFVDAGDTLQTTLIYSLQSDIYSGPTNPPHILKAREAEYWKHTGLRWTGQMRSQLHHEIERLFTASAMGLRAAIGSGFDASIWQYGYEWSGDASMVVEALVYSGQFEAAQGLLSRILSVMTNEEGMAMESSRFRGGLDAELNNNGEILRACRVFYEWTNSNDFRYYARIRAIADYLLRPEFLNAETGMLVAARDIWERSAQTGILPGYDVSHQTFAILGLRDAAWIADKLEQHDDAQRWRAAATRMRESFLDHPTHSMIDGGQIVKRRLLDGSVQHALSTVGIDPQFAKDFVPDEMPLAKEGERAWDPDVSQCFPICYRLIDPRSDIAKKTIESMDILWSQAWEDGGYGRYNIMSEPDSPGPWPFATAFMAAACLEAGDYERAHRAMVWLIERAGAAGSWFEFYGDRPTPPLPPTGIIVWGWAQWITLVVKHMLCAHVKDDKLVITPRLGGFSGNLRFRDEFVAIPE
jgi:hypothetical protein